MSGGRAPQEKGDRVEGQVKKLYLAAGCEVLSFSQGRRTRQTPGIPDFYIFHPGIHAAWWHEAKADGGKPTKPQKWVAWLVHQTTSAQIGTHSPYVIGGTEATIAQLEALGLAERWGVTIKVAAHANAWWRELGGVIEKLRPGGWK